MGCEEENALRYASGYVALKTMRELHGKKASELVDCLSNMAVIGNETTEWIKSVDRGGLFIVNDACFRLFRSIECVKQLSLPYFTQSYLHESDGKIEESVLKGIIDDDDVQFNWSVDIEDESHSAELRHILVQKWITIRGFGIASLWLEEHKRASKQTTKRKKALRKELAKRD